MDEAAALSIRIAGAQESVKRSRFAFLAITVVALILIMATWNATFSWHRDFALGSYDPEDVEKARQKGQLILTNDNPQKAFVPKQFPSDQHPVTRFIQQELLAEWVKTTSISVPVLGFRLGTADAGPLGALAILVCAVWFYYSVRRQNHIIGRLLRDTRRDEPRTREVVLHGILSAMVFLTIAANQVIRSLDEIPDERKIKPKLSPIIVGLFFLPPAAILFVIVGDLLTLFTMAAPFRPFNLPILSGPRLPSSVITKMIVWQLVAFINFLATSYYCAKSLAAELGTRQVLKQYAGELRVSRRGLEKSTDGDESPLPLEDDDAD